MVFPSRSTIITLSECSPSSSYCNDPPPTQRNKSVDQKYVLVPLTDKTRQVLSRLDPLDLLLDAATPSSFPHGSSSYVVSSDLQQVKATSASPSRHSGSVTGGSKKHETMPRSLKRRKDDDNDSSSVVFVLCRRIFNK